MTVAKKTLVLVDGSSYLFRAYHALPPLISPKGQPTGAIYGVINMLNRLIDGYDTEHIAVIFDPKGKTFRHRLYPAYKANRVSPPTDLISQIKPLFAIIDAMGIPRIVVDDIEADDTIGTITKEAIKHDMAVIIATSDKDMAQLVCDSVTLVNTMSNTTLDPEGVKQKFGVRPEQIIDYLILVGDSADNIKGVDKVGPKTAAKWLATYQSIDGLIANIDQLKGKVTNNLREFIPNIPLMRQLITIKCDAKIPYTLTDLTLGTRNHQQLMALFNELAFKRWLEKEQAYLAKSSNSDDKIVAKAILNQEDFLAYYQRLKQAPLLAIDTETTSLDSLDAKLVGISLASDQTEPVYIPVAHDYPNAPDQLDCQWLLTQLKPLLEHNQVIKVGQNIKYDQGIFANYGIELLGTVFDTMLESYVYHATASRHNMNAIASHYLNHQCTSYSDICGTGQKQISFNQVPIEQATPYAAEDAMITLQLHHYLLPKLKQEQTLYQLLTDIEMPLVPILMKMERHGVLIDGEKLKQQQEKITHAIAHLENKAYQLAGESFNLNSTKQLQTILFEKLKMPVIKKTAKGQASTAEEVLQKLATNYPLADIMLQHRSLTKLKSTYIDRLPQQINPITQRVHTSYHQAVTSTGRLSSANPNLQNIPIRTKEGQLIRQAFIAPEGCKIVAADYSQIELRIMAHLSKDETLKTAFIAGVDVHRATAAQIFAIAPEQVQPEQRRQAKAINFGLIYGMSSYGLAKQLNISRQTAQDYINSYFNRYPGVKNYMDTIEETAKQQGYVETLFGRRLYLSNINANNNQQRQAARRLAINAPMQGSAADIIKLAMIAIAQSIQQTKLKATMIMQVHDELVFEIKCEHIEEACPIIKQQMEQSTKLDIPLIVNMGVGDNWHEAH